MYGDFDVSGLGLYSYRVMTERLPMGHQSLQVPAMENISQEFEIKNQLKARRSRPFLDYI